MDEARLTPQLGHLIDEAKAAAQAAVMASRAEGVALLTEAGEVHVGHAPGAAEAALAAAGPASRDEILAAAVAVPDDPSGTVLPSLESRRVLEAIDPDLQIVFKLRGRWVMLPLSDLSTSE